MINIDLIELQKGCKATCAVIQNEDIEKLGSKIVVNSNCEDSELLKIFKEYNVSTVELEAQSMNDYILRKCGYRYSKEDIVF